MRLLAIELNNDIKGIPQRKRNIISFAVNRDLCGGVSIDEKIYCIFARYQYKRQKQSTNGRITNWWSKPASANISSKLTIRTANTVRKTVGM